MATVENKNRLLLRQFFLHHFAQDVHEEFVAFLDPHGGGSGDEQVNGGHAFGEAAVTAQEANAFEALALGLFEGAQDVFGFTAGGEGNDDVAFLAEAPDLARENFVGAIVVADGGHVFAVGR